MSTSENKSGFTLFVIAFVGTTIFFLYVLFSANQGPLDVAMWEAGPDFTLEEKKDRDHKWRTSTPEAVAAGEKLYAINIFGERLPVFEKLLGGEYGTKETEIYKIITHGVPKSDFRGLDFMPQSSRWKMVHYIRSTMTNPQRADEDDWDALDREGI